MGENFDQTPFFIGSDGTLSLHFMQENPELCHSEVVSSVHLVGNSIVNSTGKLPADELNEEDKRGSKVVDIIIEAVFIVGE